MGWKQRFGTRATQFVGTYWGETFPFYYVTEYPKSGGTWLSKMVADYLDIPKPTRTIFPMGCTCVIQNHWKYNSKLQRVIYLHRDGRDVCVSAYFHVVRGLQGPTRRHILRLYPMAESEGWSSENAASVMPSFVRNWCRIPFGCRSTWGDHIQGWLNRDNVFAVSYESLRDDCEAALAKCIDAIDGSGIDDLKIRETVAKYSFERQTGRKPGESDPTSHNRKGIVGDWKNYFDDEALSVFNSNFGEAMTLAQYEN